MAFTDEQLKGLNVASQRKILGQATPEDIKNLDYATSKGYKFQPTAPAGKVAIPGVQYNTREKQQSAFSNIEPVGNTLYGIPKLPDSLPTDKISGDTITNVPYQETFGDIDALMGGVRTGTDGLRSILEQYNTQLMSQPKKDEMTKRLETFSEAEKTAQRDLQEQTWERFGLGENVSQLQKLMPQIAMKQAEFDNLYQAQEGRTTMTSMIGGRQNLIARQKAVELAGLSAVAQAYQGNVDLARNIAQDAINAQYQDQTTYLDNLRTQLDSVRENLSREDKQRADSLNLVIAERERAIEEEKTNKLAIQDLALTIAQTGANIGIVQSILSSETPEQAIKQAVNSGAFQLSTTSDWSKIGQTKDGEDIFYDDVTKSFKTASQLLGQELGEKGLISPSGNAYDMSTYAEDEKQAQSVQNKINEIGKFNSVSDIDSYIKSKYPSSPITGQMIAEASAKYGIGWEELVALIDHESYLGTSPVARNNNNLGGITWNANFPESMKGTSRPSKEGGNYVKFNTIQDGINSVAYELAKRKVDLVEQEQKITDDGYDISKFTQEFYNTDFGQKVINNEQQTFNAFKGEQIVKNYNDVQNKAMSVQRIIYGGVGGPGDLALVFEFMKSLDPTSVVRETEYESAAKSGNIFLGAYAKFNGYLKENGGFLPENVKKSFLDITNSKLDVLQNQYDNLRSEYRRIAYSQGLNPENVAPNLNITSGQTSQIPENQELSNYISSVLESEPEKKKSGVWGWFSGLFKKPGQQLGEIASNILNK